MSEDRDNDRHTHDFEREFRQALDEASLIAVLPVYLRIEKPVVIEADDVSIGDLAYLIVQAKRAGADGVIMKLRHFTGEVVELRAVVFDGRQVKSAIGNAPKEESGNADA